MKTQTFSLIIFMLVTFSSSAQTGDDGRYFVNVNESGVILDGYDPVAFFIDSKPIPGDSKYQLQYHDAIYYFTSEEHKKIFEANPEKYEVQFGGWCAYAVSLGRVAPIDVNTFSIVNNRLVVQHNQRAVDGWNKDVQGNLEKADKYWPVVSRKDGQQIRTDEEKGYLVNTDANGIILQGYDPVSYFTDNKAVKGNPLYTARYQGATYWFSNQEHANLFKDNSEKYAPQYGAFCGYAMALNKLRPVDPAIFQITNGRLILQHSNDAYQNFNKNVQNSISLADKNWPGQVKRNAGKKVKYDKPAKPVTSTTVSK